jgi:hypothetical protein
MSPAATSGDDYRDLSFWHATVVDDLTPRAFR